MNDNLATAVDRLPRPQTGPRPQVSDRGGDAASAAGLRRPARGATSLDQLTPCLLDEFVALPAQAARPQLQPPRRDPRLLPGLGRHPAAPAGLAVAPDPATGDGSAPALPVRHRPGPAAARGSRGASRQPEGHRSRADLPRHLRSLLRPRAARRRGVRAAPRRRRRRPATRSSCGVASSARAAWSLTDRASASSSPDRSNAERVQGAAEDPTHRCSASTVGAACTRGSATQTFHRLVIELAFPVPDGVAPPHLHCLRHSLRRGVSVAVVSGGSRPVDAALPALHVHGSRRSRLHRHLPEPRLGSCIRRARIRRSAAQRGLGVAVDLGGLRWSDLAI